MKKVILSVRWTIWKSSMLEFKSFVMYMCATSNSFPGTKFDLIVTFNTFQRNCQVHGHRKSEAVKRRKWSTHHVANTLPLHLLTDRTLSNFISSHFLI